jgi:hypothetical protein
MSKHNRERRRKITAMHCPSGCDGVFKAEDIAGAVWGAHLQRSFHKRTGQDVSCPPAVAICPDCRKVFKVVRPTGREVRGRLVELTPAERFQVEAAYGGTLDAVFDGELAAGGGVFASCADPDALPSVVPWKGV